MVFLSFVLISFLVICFVAAIYFTTSSARKKWPLQGPRRVSEHLSSRNTSVFLVVLIILVVVAIFEVIIPDFSYFLRDLQTDILDGTPLWGITPIGTGSISWALYVAVLFGISVGVAAGTWSGCLRFGELKGIALRDVTVGPRTG